MAHAAKIQEGREADGISGFTTATMLRRRDQGRLQVPEQQPGALLPEREQPLAGRYQPCDGLLKIGEHDALPGNPQCAAHQPESGAVMKLHVPLRCDFNSLHDNGIRVQASDQLQQPSSQDSAGRPAFARRFQRAQAMIEGEPAFRTEWVALPIRPETIGGVAICGLQSTGLGKIVGEELRQLLDSQHLLGGQRLQSKRVRRRADRQGAVGQMEQLQQLERRIGVLNLRFRMWNGTLLTPNCVRAQR